MNEEKVDREKGLNGRREERRRRKQAAFEEGARNRASQSMRSREDLSHASIRKDKKGPRNKMKE
jgi:hypothetical protein